jgi:hypothetical protein
MKPAINAGLTPFLKLKGYMRPLLLPVMKFFILSGEKNLNDIC